MRTFRTAISYTLGLVCIFLSLSNLTGAARAETAKCAEETLRFQNLASRMNFEINAPQDLHSRGVITFQWDRADDFPLKKTVYLILVTPEEARFSGQMTKVKGPVVQESFGTSQTTDIQGPGFFALTKNSRAPLNIKFGRGRVRVFVPLHMPGVKNAGTIAIKPYRFGEFAVNWAVVAKTECGERLLHEQTKSFSVAPAQPEIVIEAPFPTEKPQKAILSNSGRYRLHIFDGRFKIFDTRTGEKILDRDGTEPRFSPTARFLSAIKDGNLELIDLVSGTVVNQLTPGVLAWTLGDAYAVLGHPRWASMQIIQMLSAQGNQPISGPGGCHACSAWESAQVAIDIDNGLVIFGKGTRITELASGRDVSCLKSGDEIYSPVDRSSCASEHIDRYYKVAPYKIPTRWDLEGGLALTHTINEDPLQQRFLVKHRELNEQQRAAPVLAARSLPENAEWRSSTADRLKRVDDLRLITEGLSDFGISILENNDLTMKSETELYSDVAAWQNDRNNSFEQKLEYRKKIVEAVPYAARLISKRDCPIADYCLGMADDLLNPKSPTLYLDHRLRNLWSVDGPKRKLRLLHLETAEGSGAFISARLFLFRSDRNDAASAIDMTDLFSQQTDDYILDKWGGTTLQPILSHDRYLIVANIESRLIALYDLEREIRRTLIKEVTAAELLQTIKLTKDARHIIQFNKDGRFFVYETASGNRLLAGRAEDNEFIVHDDRGYYASSYEGAHFVNLRFPGIPGLHTFHQFSAILQRPDVIDAILKGSVDNFPEPRLLPPPEIEIVSAEDDGADYVLRVKAHAQTQLAKLRVFLDGKLTKQVELDSKNVETEIRGLRQPHARWVTVQAIDKLGTVSLPQLQPLAPSVVISNRLLAVTAGVNTYADSGLNLKYSRADAITLRKTLNANEGKYYSSVAVTQLLDQDVSADRLLAALETAVSVAGPDDTVFFSFSGHGFKGKDDQFYLATHEIDPRDLEGTGLAWVRIADVLKQSKARMIIVIDACHSGGAGADAFAANDDAVKALVSNIEVPMLVFAASKGRQQAYEHPDVGGGYFTRALADVLTTERQKHDTNGNGAIEISELYVGAKAKVVAQTHGQQTPWLARFDLIGDFAVF